MLHESAVVILLGKWMVKFILCIYAAASHLQQINCFCYFQLYFQFSATLSYVSRSLVREWKHLIALIDRTWHFSMSTWAANHSVSQLVLTVQHLSPDASRSWIFQTATVKIKGAYDNCLVEVEACKAHWSWNVLVLKKNKWFLVWRQKRAGYDIGILKTVFIGPSFKSWQWSGNKRWVIGCA